MRICTHFRRLLCTPTRHVKVFHGYLTCYTYYNTTRPSVHSLTLPHHPVCGLRCTCPCPCPCQFPISSLDLSIEYLFFCRHESITPTNPSLPNQISFLFTHQHSHCVRIAPGLPTTTSLFLEFAIMYFITLLSLLHLSLAPFASTAPPAAYRPNTALVTHYSLRVDPVKSGLDARYVGRMNTVSLANGK